MVQHDCTVVWLLNYPVTLVKLQGSTGKIKQLTVKSLLDNPKKIVNHQTKNTDGKLAARRSAKLMGKGGKDMCHQSDGKIKPCNAKKNRAKGGPEKMKTCSTCQIKKRLSLTKTAEEMMVAGVLVENVRKLHKTLKRNANTILHTAIALKE